MKKLFFSVIASLVLLFLCFFISKKITSQGIGHTREYLEACADRHRNDDITDTDIKNLIQLHPELPSKWINEVSRKVVNDEGMEEVCFVLIDGTIAWVYSYYYLPDGSIKDGHSMKHDAKEYDPAYTDIINNVNQKVRDRMKRENISGLGSIHAFWGFKKILLKEEGIDWRSPSELNPGILFD